MKVVIDTNIIFSALVNSEGKIGDLIFNSKNVFEFYGSEFLKSEITNHWKKLQQASKLSDQQLTTAQNKLYEQIYFINQDLLRQDILLEAENLVQDIDPDDTFFVALTIAMNGALWTGDKELKEGLRKKNFQQVYTTNDLWEKRKEMGG